MKYLITAIGGDIAQHVSQIIRSYDDKALIVGTDTGSRHAGKIFIDRFKMVPPAKKSAAFCDYLFSLIREFEIDFFLPMSEPEIEVIKRHTHLFTDCHIIFPGVDVVDVCADKYLTAKFLKSVEVEVPWTLTVDDNLPSEFPCIFKGRKGAGSKLLYTVDSFEEAQFLSKKFPNGLFQELLQPQDNEITCGVFRSKNKDIAVIQFQRLLNEGTTSWARTYGNDTVKELCIKVANKLNLQGSMNIQLILTTDGPRIFEINPRFSSTVYMRHLLGFDDVIWSIKDAMGVSFEYPKIPIGIELVRTQKSELLT